MPTRRLSFYESVRVASLSWHDVVFFPVIHLVVAPATCGDSAFQNLLVSARRQGTMRAAVSRA